MYILPAIDLYKGFAVRLLKGDYGKMTVYSKEPVKVTETFKACGAEYLHVVDLEGAKDGTTSNFDVIKSIIAKTDMKVEIGGGIRNDETIKEYIDAGAERVILGTAAVRDKEFLKRAVDCYGEKIAVGVDIKNGFVAVKGWLEVTEIECFSFCAELEMLGVKTVICTDISKDGMLGGANTELYKKLNETFDLNIIASGGVSTMEDIKALAAMDMYGAIVGKAVYENAIDLREAILNGRNMKEEK